MIRSLNPDSPSDVVDAFEPDGPEAIDEEVQRARASLEEWRASGAPARSRAMNAISRELEERAAEAASLLVREVGKPITEARAEVSRAVAIWRYYAQIALLPDGETYPAAGPRQWLITRRYAVGACAVITPWNFPMVIPTWKMAPALAFGNAVVWKPSPEATACGRLLADIADSHLTEGVLGVVQGDAETGSALLGHADVAAVSFTGSVPVGKQVAVEAARRGMRVQCEMGGQNASLVLADADLDHAASTIAYAAMGYAGQKCTATSRVIVEEPAYAEFRDRLVAAIEGLPIVDPRDEACVVGPLISDRARASALEAIVQSGGAVLTGGTTLEGEGFYLCPTLVEVQDPSSPVFAQEVFAPVAAIIRAASMDEGIRLANTVEYGLVAALFSRDVGRIMDFSDRIEAGLIRVNAPTSGVDFHAPFGGTKSSSFGPREQGLAAREFFTESRTLLISAGA